MNAAKKLVTFVKKETVLCIAGLLAVVSMFIIHPSADYFGYIDYRVLALLFCFMAVVAGFRSVGLFEWLIKKMLCYVKNARQLELVLVLGCFFASMWITNDVALLTFVPFAVAVLQAAGLTENLIFVIVMQTIAANLGSMCTPIRRISICIRCRAVRLQRFKAYVSGDGGVTWITAGDVALYS